MVRVKFKGKMWFCYQQVHTSSSSNVADHGLHFALSDSHDSEYQQSCSHDHQDTWGRCENLHIILSGIKNIVFVTQLLNDIHKDEAMYTFQTAELAIMSWKGHIVRSANQDSARTDALEKLHEKKIFIVNDLAMKFLLQKNRKYILAHLCCVLPLWWEPPMTGLHSHYSIM